MKVTFCQTKDNTIHFVERIKKRDISKKWFTNEDYHRMKLKDDMILRYFMESSLSFGIGAGSSSELDGLNRRHRQLFIDGHGVVCMRGLEKMTHDGFMKQATIRRVATLAVLQEQHSQRKHRLSCAYRISQAYSRYTCKSQKDAHIVGLADEEYVMKKCLSSSRNLLLDIQQEQQRKGVLHQVDTTNNKDNTIPPGKVKAKGRLVLVSKCSTTSSHNDDDDADVRSGPPPSPSPPIPHSPPFASRWSPKIMRKKLKSIGGSLKKSFQL